MGGVVIEQPSGAVGFWEGGRYEHASSCGIRVLKDKEDLGSVGLVLVQKWCLLRQTNCFKEKTAHVADIESMWDRELMRSGIGEQEYKTLQEYYKGFPITD